MEITVAVKVDHLPTAYNAPIRTPASDKLRTILVPKVNHKGTVQAILAGRDLGFRTRAKYTSIVWASDASERLGLKLHGGKKKKKEQKLDYHHVGCFEVPQCWFLVTLYYCGESWRFQNCTWMRILSWCMGTRMVDLLILLKRSSWMIIISWTHPHCSWRQFFFQIHLKLGPSHSPPFVCMQTQMWWFATEFETQMFHGSSSSQFVVGWSSVWWVPAPSLSLGVFFCTSKSHLCPLHHLAMFFCNPRLPPEGCKLDNYQQYVIKWTDLERRMWPIGVWSILITEAP